MRMRRGLLVSLLFTAGLLAALPALWSRVADGAPRVSDRLRPARLQPLIVWLVEDPTGSSASLRRAFATFEKTHRGARVTLRQATADELYVKDAVKPDVVLFGGGAVLREALLPISGQPYCREDALSSGRSAGALYAVPVWYAPSVLAVPSSWLTQGDAPAPTATPLFAPTSVVQPLATPVPPSVPWARTAERIGGVRGVALQQLLLDCPAAHRAALLTSLAAQWDADGALLPCPTDAATVVTLAASRRMESATCFPLKPAVCDRALYIGFPKQSELGWELLEHLLRASPEGLFVTRPGSPTHETDALSRALAEIYQPGLVLPNAFEHNAAERDELCRAGLGDDPVEVLLRLR